MYELGWGHRFPISRPVGVLVPSILYIKSYIKNRDCVLWAYYVLGSVLGILSTFNPNVIPMLKIRKNNLPKVKHVISG